MIHEDAAQGLQTVLFPVREVPVYTQIKPGSPREIPRKKALVNGHTGHVLAIVSRTYNVVLNCDALELAKKCCIAAFPNTVLTNWSVFAVEAAKTGGHCHIDLAHQGPTQAYDWGFSRSVQDRYEPFVRLTNSYNRTRRLAIDFGLVRFKCTNGVVIWDESIRLSFAHDEPNIERRVESVIYGAKFTAIIDRFVHQNDRLRDVDIPICYFRPIMLSALRIRKPDGLPEYRKSMWKDLEEHFDRTAKKYVGEHGSNGLALLNAVTDIATRPPDHERSDRLIRRERHDLQRLGGRWLSSFTKSLDRASFDLDAYLKNPSDRLLLS